MKLSISLACVLLCVLVCVEALRMDPQFAKFITDYKKSYNPAEMPRRMRAFKENVVRIAQLNEEARSQGLDTTWAINKFSDLTPEEFKSIYLGYKKNPNTPPAPQWKRPEGIELKSSYDWRSQGVVSPVKDQGQCGSCWAFSTAEGVESAYALSKSSLLELSPQQIVDCDTEGSGCNGGWPNQAMNWIISQGGQDTESSYPYTGQDGNCASASGTIGATIRSVVPVAQSESAMYSALRTMPLSICADAQPWQDYSGGILTAAQCGSSIDHAIQLTGYNPTQGGYWIVRNSWGVNWGINGFIWLQYGQDTCGITSYTNYATV